MAEITVEREGNTVIARIRGRVEGRTSATDFQEALESSIAGDTRGLVLDCGELVYISSSGLRAIAIIINRTQGEGISIRACEMLPPIRGVFEVTGFDQLVGIVETREQALREMERTGA